MDRTFEFLKKKSASPSIMIVNKNAVPNYIMKIWSADNHNRDAQALDYEKIVYDTNIRELLKKHPDAPLLPAIGNGCNVTIQELYELLGVTRGMNTQIFIIGFFIFLLNPGFKFDYSDDEKILKYYKKYKLTTDQLSDITSQRLHCIMLPFVEFNDLNDTLETASTELITNVIKQIILGIKLVYESGLINNDLHGGNVMIENETDKVYLFDWHRGYIDGKPNPYLDTNRCSERELCRFSQCNIYNEDGYAIDLYKILYSVLTVRKDDRKYLLKTMFNVSDSDEVMNFVIKKLTKNAYFMSPDGCTYLQYPDKEMRTISRVLGSIQEVFYTNFPEDNKKLDKSDTSVYKSLVSFIIRSYGKPPTSAFKTSTPKGPRDMFNKDPYVDILSEKHTKTFLKVKNRKSKINLNKIDKMDSHTQYLLNLSPDKATYQDLINLKRLKNKLESGNIKSNYKTVTGRKSLPPKDIGTIMEENNIRKYGPGKEIE